MLIYEVEEKIEQYYEHIALAPAFRDAVETHLVAELKEARKEAESELVDLRRQQDSLERQRDKLMQAHYEGAVPVDLLKREQDRIASALLAITTKLEASNLHFDVVERNLGMALDLSRDCAQAYKTAPDHIRRQFNQVFFKRVLVHWDASVTAELAPPFDVIIGQAPEADSAEDGLVTPENTKKPALSNGLLRKSSNSNSGLGHSVLSHAHSSSKTFMVELSEANAEKWQPLLDHAVLARAGTAESRPTRARMAKGDVTKLLQPMYRTRLPGHGSVLCGDLLSGLSVPRVSGL